MGDYLTYSARIRFSAEGTTSSTWTWSKEKLATATTPTVLHTLPHLEDKAETVKIDTSGYLCRLQKGLIYCYSPIARRCVVLRADRSEKPDVVIAKRGCEAKGV